MFVFQEFGLVMIFFFICLNLTIRSVIISYYSSDHEGRVKEAKGSGDWAYDLKGNFNRQKYYWEPSQKNGKATLKRLLMEKKLIR